MDDVEVARPSRNVSVVALRGEHDIATKEQLRALLSTEIGNNELVIVDVTDAGFVDSAVLHNLFGADRLAREGGSRFVLQMGTAPIVRRAIEISGLLDVVTWVGSRAEALSLHPDAGGVPVHVRAPT